MNITLICGHYLPDLGYIEVHLARALADLGHVVSVVTSSAVPPYVAHLQGPVQTGTEHDGKVKVIRLKPRFELGQVVTARWLNAAVLGEHPDLLIAIGLGKRFPQPVFGLDIPVITLFGDNLHSYAGTTFAERLKTKLQFSLLKATTYQAAIDKSAKLVAYTPESFEAAAAMLGGRFRKKLLAQDRFISLGFDPKQFYFDPALRQKERELAKIEDDQKVVITATRVVPEKQLENALEMFRSLPDFWRWTVVGGSDSDYSREFADKARKALGKSRFKMIAYRDRSGLNVLFNAADVALYTVPAISVFEVLGTGLPCLIPNVPSLSHVKAETDLAIAFDDLGDTSFRDRILRIDTDPLARISRAAKAADLFSWQSIAGRLLKL